MKQRIVTLLVLLAALVTFSGCSALSAIPGMPKTQEVELNVAAVCATCSPATHKTINPFSAEKPVKYTKVGIANIDNFVESANKLYGTTLLLEKLVGMGTQMTSDPNMKVEGFKSKDDVMGLAKGLFTAASSDVPKLITASTEMVTNAGALASDPKNAMVAPTAITEVKTAIERLNESKDKLAAMATSFGGE